ncbi:hypothetical protein SAMN05444678_12325 [Sphingomonas sp. YR710]|uniref:hypothetical protein n=1 Tax=Sphingomonas sp. YR710 TaxID=1882773 RepID=UPI0008878B87|nr:hypothetical protein [Sphingomonas sp. YR710]SDD80715.1 hypothetical protein SAMN05444678_12325 [Sphingomonas sp. YR710]
MSFDYAWTEQQAVNLAQIRFSDLIVVGDDLEKGSSLTAAVMISRDRDVAILRTAYKHFRVFFLPYTSTSR